MPVRSYFNIFLFKILTFKINLSFQESGRPDRLPDTELCLRLSLKVCLIYFLKFTISQLQHLIVATELWWRKLLAIALVWLVSCWQELDTSAWLSTHNFYIDGGRWRFIGAKSGSEITGWCKSRIQKIARCGFLPWCFSKLASHRTISSFLWISWEHNWATILLRIKWLKIVHSRL